MNFSGMGYDRLMADNLKRKLFLKSEIKKVILKSILKNKSIPYYLRYSAHFSKVSFARLSSISQKRNRCLRSGRVWSTINKVKMSRFIFLKESYKGNIPGLRRKSW